MKKQIHIEGMMCGHCESVIERALSAVDGVRQAKADHARKRALVTLAHEVDDAALIAAVEATGYHVVGVAAAEDAPDRARPGWFVTLMLVIAGLVLFFLARRFSVLALPESVPAAATGGVIFIIGVITSFHCLAMCGGINLGVCMRFAGARSLLPSALYNGGRLISYTVSGAVVGALGSVITVTDGTRAGIVIIAGGFMILMGLSMTGLIRLPRLPGRVGALSVRLSHAGASLPLVAGLLSAFMPCGPLQAMQLFALASGGAKSGALAMFFFALGTMPLMFGLGAVSGLIGRRTASVIYRAGGLLVIAMAIVMISGALALAGLRAPVAAGGAGAATAAVEPGAQRVVSIVGPYSYQSVIVQKGVPLELIFRAPEGSLNGCNNALAIPDYAPSVRLHAGDTVVRFTPGESGVIGFACWMGMIQGSIVVVDDIAQSSGVRVPEPPRGGACSCCAGAGEFNQLQGPVKQGEDER